MSVFRPFSRVFFFFVTPRQVIYRGFYYRRRYQPKVNRCRCSIVLQVFFVNEYPYVWGVADFFPVFGFAKRNMDRYKAVNNVYVLLRYWEINAIFFEIGVGSQCNGVSGYVIKSDRCQINVVGRLLVDEVVEFILYFSLLRCVVSLFWQVRTIVASVPIGGTWGEGGYCHCGSLRLGFVCSFIVYVGSLKDFLGYSGGRLRGWSNILGPAEGRASFVLCLPMSDVHTLSFDLVDLV